MCRFALYLGPPAPLGSLLKHPARSLTQQARHSDLGSQRTNIDGCGVAWYPSSGAPGPLRFRDTAPAFESARWRQLADSETGGCILGHVRAATPGLTVGLDNCHPFTWRELAFAHNGALPEFERFGPALRTMLSPHARGLIRGNADTEHVFALFTDQWRSLEAGDPALRLESALRTTLAMLEDLRWTLGIEEPAYLNFAVTDGLRGVVSRYAAGDRAAAHTLYVRQNLGRRRAGTTRVDHAASQVIVASEPLDQGPGWLAISEDQLICVDAARRVTRTPLHSRAGYRAA